MRAENDTIAVTTASWPTRYLYVLVAVVWAITRIYPLTQAQPWTGWEIAEARKLLQYGFAERLGAMIDIQFLAGLMSDPWKYNYVNHPYPILWFDTFIYWLGGPWTVLLTTSFLGLLACLAVLPALQRNFSRREAVLGALLYTLTPATILFDADTNIVALGAIVWPFAAYVIGQNLREHRYVPAVLLAAIIFIGGQISWFTYTLLPVMVLATIGLAFDAATGFLPEPNRPLLAAVISGASLTIGLFLLQIWLYTYNFSGALAYVHGQASPESGTPLPRMYLAMTMRTGLSLGPSLVLGSLVGAFLLIKSRAINWLQLASLLYPLCFIAAALALPRFFYRERTMYGYLVFPCCVLTLTALQHLKRTRITAGTLCLAVVSLSYPILQASIPKVSETSKQLGYYIRGISQPDEVVVTNLEPQEPPFQLWDVGSIRNTCLVADRTIRESISTAQSLEALLTIFQRSELTIIFLRDLNRPIDESLGALLARQTREELPPFRVPREPLSPATQLRSIYWSITKKHQSGQADNHPTNLEDFEMFRLKLSRKVAAPNQEQ